METKGRIVYSDILKTVAIMGVIFIHVSSAGVLEHSPMSADLILSVFWASVVRWSVPVFFMCSGIVFLNPLKPLKTSKIYTKYIPRLISALIFWALVYEAEPILYTFIRTGIADLFLIKTAFKNLVTFNTHFHLYFIYIIILTYALVPLIRIFLRTAARKDVEYLLGFWVLFAIIFPFVTSFYPFNLIGGIIPQYKINLTYGLMGYFILGHYVNTYSFKKRTRNLIFSLGILGLLITFLGTVYLLLIRYDNPLLLFEGMSPNVFMMAFAVFYLFKGIGSRVRSEKIKMAFFILSKSSFCIYLVHDIINIIFRRLGYFTLNNAFFSIPLVSASVFSLSLLIYFVLSKIKIVNKYLI